MVEQDAPVIEEEPTNGYRIISVSGSSSRLEYVIGYPSVRPDGTEVELSGWLAVPTRNGAFNGDHFLMSSHYTMTKNSEVPSAAGPMESTIYSLSSSKPVMVAPDYLGYGITADEVHPYVAPILDGSITTSLDMKPAYPADNIMYDVLGRRIATSARGQIYILNGKKYIQQ